MRAPNPFSFTSHVLQTRYVGFRMVPYCRFTCSFVEGVSKKYDGIFHSGYRDLLDPDEKGAELLEVDEFALVMIELFK